MQRLYNSSCAIGSMIYTVAGREIDNSSVDSIERLNAKTLLSGTKNTLWEVLNIQNNVMPLMMSSVVAPIGHSEIAILGGNNMRGRLGSLGQLGDVYIFNTHKNELKTVF